ncbi:MAG: protein BatD [Bacteroidales bacterium]|nr:protein BatD [Bacteroidales bacterium]
MKKLKRRMMLMITALLFVLPVWLSAQQVEFSGVAKSVVTLGERFQLQYRINAEGTGFKGPNIVDFNVLNGPNTSTSSSVQIVGGNVTREVSYTFTYILASTKEGTFTIPPATINYAGKKYTSNSVTVQVKSGGQTAPSGQGSQQQGSDEAVDVFLRAEVSNTAPYLGEQIIISYKLYFNNQIAGHDGFQKISSFPGFWVKNLFPNQREIPTATETIKGKQYNVAEVRRFALFPQRTGKIDISPGETELTVLLRTDAKRRTSDPFFDSFFNDPFFSSRSKDVTKNLLSNSITVDVKPLPTKERPADFSGAVGKFTLRSQIDKTEVKANEPISIKLTVQGSGNIELFDLPKIAFPPDFEVFDPEIKSDIKVTPSGVSGTRTFEYLVIPRNPGNFKIRPIEFSHFDLGQNVYISERTPEYNITVERGDGASSVVTYSGTVRQEGIQIIGSDIRHIKLPPYSFRPVGTYFFRSQSYFLFLIIPLILLILVLVVWSKQMKKRGNAELMKNLRATKIARKRLKLAHEFMKNSKESEFYIEISRASWGYLSDKLSIPVSELSMDNVRTRLTSKNTNEETINQFIETLNQTEFARFAPGSKTDNMEKVYTGALEIITKLEKELK